MDFKKIIMKKNTILLILCLAFGYVNAQTILVNGNVISVQEDVTFPLWLDSMSTIETGTQVVSISALEFYIVPNSNGNSLVFSQTKTITYQETVPNGMTWKITAVLLDSTATNNSYSVGGGQVISSGGGGGNTVVALSEESVSEMQLPEAMDYCDSLQEGGYDDWVVPTIEEFMFSISGGVPFTNVRNTNEIWTISKDNGGGSDILTVNTNGGTSTRSWYSLAYARCVRYGYISVSGLGSSSGGSNSISGLGGGNIPVALSEESAGTMQMGDALIYCDSLQEGGYDNWVVPNWEELMFAIGGGIPFVGTRSSNKLWTSTFSPDGIYEYMAVSTLGYQWAYGGTSLLNVRCVRHGAISVSGSGSSSGGSNTPSTLGSAMPTMISNESANKMFWSDAILYCETLSESGFSDWIMPSLDQITYAISGGCVINDGRTLEEIWTRSVAYQQGDMFVVRLLEVPNDGPSVNYRYTDSESSPTNSSYSAKCRCVR